MKSKLEISGLRPWDVVQAFPKESKTLAPQILFNLRELYVTAWISYVQDLLDLREIPTENRPLLESFLEAIHWDIFKPLKDQIQFLETIVWLSRDSNNSPRPPMNYNILDICAALGIEVRKMGKYYKALCPFHEEKHPSFTIFDDKRWNCFGCGARGDGIDLLMRLKNTAYTGAKGYIEGIYERNNH